MITPIVSEIIRKMFLLEWSEKLSKISDRIKISDRETIWGLISQTRLISLDIVANGNCMGIMAAIVQYILYRIEFKENFQGKRNYSEHGNRFFKHRFNQLMLIVYLESLEL